MLKPLTPNDYRQLFCAALRSGKYIRIEGEDWDGNLVCALGVGVREGLFEDPRELSQTEQLGRQVDNFYCKPNETKAPYDKGRHRRLARLTA